jgi:hypothetical protein
MIKWCSYLRADLASDIRVIKILSENACFWSKNDFFGAKSGHTKISMAAQAVNCFWNVFCFVLGGWRIK